MIEVIREVVRTLLLTGVVVFVIGGVVAGFGWVILVGSAWERANEVDGMISVGVLMMGGGFALTAVMMILWLFVGGGAGYP